MSPAKVPGTEGYANAAQTLIARWRAISFAEHHQAVLHHLPGRPSRILDVGAGIGSDAAALAAMGHSAVAVEPVDELRDAAKNLHAMANVAWLDDSLPALESLLSKKETFEIILLTAVWMHLDEAQRSQGMPVVSRLLHKGGKLLMSLRHGPIPPGRRMFDVSAEETIHLAGAHDLKLVFQVLAESVQSINRDNGVRWTRLVFEKVN